MYFTAETTQVVSPAWFLSLFLVPPRLCDTTCVTETNYKYDRDNYRGKMKCSDLLMVSVLLCKLSAKFAFRYPT